LAQRDRRVRPGGRGRGGDGVAPGQERAPASTLQKPEVDAPKQTPSLPATGETLSERLDRTDGVIKPPAGVDPGIHAAPKDPNAGSNMPVPAAGQPGRRSERSAEVT